VSIGPDRKADADRVRNALLNELKVHPRIVDQGHGPDDEMRQKLVEILPSLSAFSDHRFRWVRVIMDWDHQIPSQYILLRVYACYDLETLERVDAILEERDDEINETNLYPEFDLPDYGEIEGSETYVAVLRPGEVKVEDFRFLSTWRKQVDPKLAESAVKVVRADAGYRKAASSRKTDGLGGPVVIGWAPPCLADTEGWAIEIWLLTEFDGHSGKARVFMIDTENSRVSKEFDTDVQLA
jgi:hypothetical protein